MMKVWHRSSSMTLLIRALYYPSGVVNILLYIESVGVVIEICAALATRAERRALHKCRDKAVSYAGKMTH